MGKWSDFSGVMLTPEMLEDAISDILEDYGDVVYNMTEEGLTKAEKILIKNLKDATPGSPPHKRNFAKNWKGKGKKYKLRRFVGNTTVVPGKSGDIALANIFEYSTTRGKPFIKATFEKSVPEMAQVIVDEIKKGV
jgi:hypothetical protein